MTSSFLVLNAARLKSFSAAVRTGEPKMWPYRRILLVVLSLTISHDQVQDEIGLSEAEFGPGRVRFVVALVNDDRVRSLLLAQPRSQSVG